VGAAIAEPLRIFRAAGPREIQGRVEDLMSEVGLDPRFLKRYPHQFSGGQRQRIGMARALALNPRVLVCDEPLSALDVSIQAQILNLLIMERDRRGLSYLFIAHDLNVIRRIAGRVAVMYLGRIVEEGPVGEIYSSPAHPYTRALLSAAPIPDPGRGQVRGRTIPGPAMDADPSGPTIPPGGCAFAGRCPVALDSCWEKVPRLRDFLEDPAHRVACFLHHPPGE
jgi:oligopeptide/dipeptide ABC transporter ATP-binding protein